MKFINVLLLAALFMVACTTKSPEPIVVEIPAPIEEVTTSDRVELYWENTTEPHPERAPWSDEVVATFKKDFEIYSKASDVSEICPKFNSLDQQGKLKALGEFWVATAYFESGFDPKQYSVDVGSKNDKESWSVGLYQMSGNDSSAKEIKANFETLKNPIVNIQVSMIQLKKQVSKRGKFLLDNSDPMRYWAVILKGNKYSKIEDIKKRVLKHAPMCK